MKLVTSKAMARLVVRCDLWQEAPRFQQELNSQFMPRISDEFSSGRTLESLRSMILRDYPTLQPISALFRNNNAIPFIDFLHSLETLPGDAVDGNNLPDPR